MIKLSIEAKQLQPTRTIFLGIMAGHSCSPIVRIRLYVLFGTNYQFHCKPIWFEVVYLSSPYHTLLGRPVLAKFMPVSHYAYLKMKLPGPRGGLITIVGNYRKSIVYAQADNKLVESLVITEERH